jgi:hypothetical protein
MGEHQRNGGWAVGVGGLVMLLITSACGHSGGKLEPPARAAVTETRGLCPTDLNQAQMVVREGSDSVAVGFRTHDPSKVEEISRRAAEMGEALASVHPAVGGQGQLVQHAPAPKPELRELADGTGNGVELLFRTSGHQKAALLANLNDHERMWRRGECPIMSDESVHPGETRNWKRVDR